MFPYSILTWEKKNCLLTFYKKDYYFAYLSYTNWNIFISFWYICFSLLFYHFLTSNNCHFVSILIIFIITLQILRTIGMRFFFFSFIYCCFLFWFGFGFYLLVHRYYLNICSSLRFSLWGNPLIKSWLRELCL